MSTVNIIKEIKRKLVAGENPEKVIDFIDGVLVTLKEQSVDFLPTPTSPSISPLIPANPLSPIGDAPWPPGYGTLRNGTLSTGEDIVLCKATT